MMRSAALFGYGGSASLPALILFVIFALLSACVTSANGPARLTMTDTEIAQMRTGLWRGEIVEGDERTVWIDRVYPDGQLVILFETYRDGALVHRNMELCAWRIIDGVEHVTTLLIIGPNGIRQPETNTGTYEEFYEILQVTEDSITYQHLDDGTLYRSVRLAAEP